MARLGSSPPRPDAARPPPLRRNRDFNLLWAGQAVSGMGSALSGVCYPLLILAVTGSAADAGVVSGAGLIANLVFLLPAGVVADRYPRKPIMVSASLVQMVVVGTVAPAVLSHKVCIAQLVAVGAVQGAAAAFFTGASRGAMRRVVPAEQLRQAFARTQARDQAVSLAGAPAGGAMFSLARFLPFACDAASFGCIAIATALIQGPLDPEAAPSGPRQPLRRSVTTGMRFIFADGLLRTIAVWGGAVNAISAGMLLLVIVLARQEGASPTVIGLLLSTTAGSGIVGSLTAPRIVALVGGRNLALIASWFLPVGALAMALAPSIWLIAVRGAATVLMVTAVNVVFGAHTAGAAPDHLQAQASNAMQLSVSSFAWLTPPVFGMLADSLGARHAILIGAGLLALIAAVLQFAPHLRRLDAENAGQ